MISFQARPIHRLLSAIKIMDMRVYNDFYIITIYRLESATKSCHRLRGSASTVLTAMGQVNERWRTLTHHRIETHEPTATKFRTIDYVRGITLNQISYKSIHWGLLGIWVKYNVFVPFLFINVKKTGLYTS